MGKKAGNFRKIIFSCTAILFLFLVAGCSVTDLGGEKKQELDFTVLEKEDIPEELQETIEEKKDEPMKLTYTDQGQMVLVRGYGKKESSGYSIEVKELYATENAVHIRRGLILLSNWIIITDMLSLKNEEVPYGVGEKTDCKTVEWKTGYGPVSD